MSNFHKIAVRTIFVPKVNFFVLLLNIIPNCNDIFILYAYDSSLKT